MRTINFCVWGTVWGLSKGLGGCAPFVKLFYQNESAPANLKKDFHTIRPPKSLKTVIQGQNYFFLNHVQVDDHSKTLSVVPLSDPVFMVFMYKYRRSDFRWKQQNAKENNADLFQERYTHIVQQSSRTNLYPGSWYSGTSIFPTMSSLFFRRGQFMSSPWKYKRTVTSM
jgi:hypothetical protein